MMQTQYFPASERGRKNIGWLKSNFFFSFSDYYHPLKSAFGTLFAFNDDYMEMGKGFGIHPHINMEIISVLIQGKMNHIDSTRIQHHDRRRRRPDYERRQRHHASGI